MTGLDFITGKELPKSELIVVRGGVSVAAQGGNNCGRVCDGGGGNGCGKNCIPSQQR